MSRAGASFAAAVLAVAGLTVAVATGAAAQTPAPAPAPSAGPAPGATVGGATLERTVNYAGPPANRPDLGTAYFYRTGKRLVITLQIYDGGKRVPPGSSNPMVVSEFSREVADLAQQFKGSGYSSVELPAVPSSCTYGAVTLRCITYSAQSANGARFYSKLLMTGAGSHFVKVRIDWGQALQQTAADAEAALQAFVPAAVR